MNIKGNKISAYGINDNLDITRSKLEAVILAANSGKATCLDGIHAE